LMSLKDDIFADYQAFARCKTKTNWPRVILMTVRSLGFRVVLLHRIGHWHRRRRRRLIAGVCDRLIWSCGADLNTGAEIGAGFRLPHPIGVVVGSGVKIGQRVRILQGATLGGEGGKAREDGQTQPSVGDDVIIGAGAALLGPIRVGNRVKIGANAVVVDDVPEGATVVGVPGRPV